MVIFLCMLFAAGLSYRWILGALAVVVPCGALFIYLLQYNMVPFLKDYQVRRIMAFIDPANYAEANLQQNNSIMAIGSGMLQGKGLNNNTLASVKKRKLPVRGTDRLYLCCHRRRVRVYRMHSRDLSDCADSL
ncbi:MAG: FtsW/RodA/SpoVE family cell cycle protein [Clostridium sp.]